MMKGIGSIIALVVVLSASAYAQAALTGKWRGTTNAGAELVLDLIAKETTLTGTLTRDGQTSTLSDGQISKNTFTFSAQVSDRVETFAGQVTGDEITIWLERQGPERAIMLKREKAR
jgi:hypothetical protein